MQFVLVKISAQFAQIKMGVAAQNRQKSQSNPKFGIQGQSKASV